MKKGKLTLSRSTYQDLLSKMRDCNRAINTLTEQNRNLLPTRRSRSRYDHFRLIRDHAKDVYNALCASFSCSCAPHSINWQLDVPTEQKSAQFRCITAVEQLDDTNKGAKARKAYYEVEMRPSDEARVETKQQSSSTPLTGKKAKKVLRFAGDFGYPNPGVMQMESAQSSSSSTVTLSEISKPTLAGAQELKLPIRQPELDLQIYDFCGRLCASSFEVKTKGLGYLGLANQRRYEVFPLHSRQGHEEEPYPLSLASLLSGSQTTPATTLSLHDRLQLAKSVSTGVLQLYNSPLLQSAWTKENIVFVPWTKTPFRKAYIEKSTSRAKENVYNTDVPPYIHNQTIFALGVLLIEICLGRAIGDLRTLKDCNSEAEMRMPSLAADYSTAMRLLESEQILVESGEWYADAVRRCISCNFGPTKTDLENDEFRQAVYSGVVAPLEEQVKLVLGSSAL